MQNLIRMDLILTGDLAAAKSPQKRFQGHFYAALFYTFSSCPFGGKNRRKWGRAVTGIQLFYEQIIEFIYDGRKVYITEIPFLPLQT